MEGIMKSIVLAAVAVLAVMLSGCSSEVAEPTDKAEQSSKVPPAAVSQTTDEDREELYDAVSWTVSPGGSLVAADVLHGADAVSVPLPNNVVETQATIICRDGGSFDLQYLEDGKMVVQTDLPCDGTLQGLMYEIPLINGSVVLTPPADTDWSYQVVVKQ